MESSKADEMMSQYLGKRKFNFFYSINNRAIHGPYVGIVTDEEMEKRIEKVSADQVFVTEQVMAVIDLLPQIDVYVLALSKDEADELIERTQCLMKGSK